MKSSELSFSVPSRRPQLTSRYLLDQIVILFGPHRRHVLIAQPPPDKDEDKMVSKLRETLKRSLEEVRKNAE